MPANGSDVAATVRMRRRPQP